MRMKKENGKFGILSWSVQYYLSLFAYVVVSLLSPGWNFAVSIQTQGKLVSIQPFGQYINTEEAVGAIEVEVLEGVVAVTLGEEEVAAEEMVGAVEIQRCINFYAKSQVMNKKDKMMWISNAVIRMGVIRV